MLRISVELPDRNKAEADVFEADEIKTFIKDGWLIVFVGNERKQFAYAPGMAQGFVIEEVGEDDGQE